MLSQLYYGNVVAMFGAMHSFDPSALEANGVAGSQRSRSQTFSPLGMKV